MALWSDRPKVPEGADATTSIRGRRSDSTSEGVTVDGAEWRPSAPFHWDNNKAPSAVRFGRDTCSLPPLAEQKRIVAKLDALNAKSARIAPPVSRYKQAVLSKAFSGELTPR